MPNESKKVVIWTFIVFSMLAIMYVVIQVERDMQKIDGLVYTFIVGKVEGNDDLLATILTDEAQGILKPGRHAYPGDMEKVGDQYEIMRWDGRHHEGAMIYEVKFLRPSTGKVDLYNVLVLKTEDGWKIAKNSSVDNLLIETIKRESDGLLIHEFGFGGD